MGNTFKSFVEDLLSFRTTAGNEKQAQMWFKEQLSGFGFQTYEWSADADILSNHPSFPSNPDAIDTSNRPSVAGVMDLGDPEDGPTVVLNGHVDVVPTESDQWESDPFSPHWDGAHLVGRGAADMKSGLSASLFAAKELGDRDADRENLNGRVVIESVVGEEEGGIGAAMAALSNPYPFERDAAIIAEPTELGLVTAVEGSAMLRLELEGRSAHAATRWKGESVLPHFEKIRRCLQELEANRAKEVSHPLYNRFENPWPISIGTVNAGKWASSAPASLTAEIRVGVAPGETVSEVEEEVHDAINELALKDEWLKSHPPALDRFSIQFEPAEVSEDAHVVKALQEGMANNGLNNTAPTGETYGADSRHYQAAGIPTAVFGPGSIEQGHFPNESIYWPEVEQSKHVLTDTLVSLLRPSTGSDEV